MNKIKKICKNCKKIFYVIPYRKNTAKFHSTKCMYNNRKKYGFLGGKIGGKVTHQKYPELQREWTSKAGKIGGRNVQKILKKLKIGIYDPKVRSMGGKAGGSKGGLNAQKTLRQNVRNLPFKGQHYDSPDEIEFSICLQEQYKYKPKEGINLHIRMKGGEIDFLLENLKLFVEEHRYFRGETKLEYFKRRRKILNENGYKNYKLVVIQ